MRGLDGGATLAAVVVGDGLCELALGRLDPGVRLALRLVRLGLCDLGGLDVDDLAVTCRRLLRPDLGEALLGQLQFNTYQVELILNKSFVNLKQKVVTIQQAVPLNPSETGLGLLLELLLLLKLT